MSESLIVLINMPDAQSAKVLARQLVELRLAACVNIFPEMQSVYRWQGAIEEASETSVLIKTVRERYVEIEATIRKTHPYQTPEIIAVPIVAGLTEYLGWIERETKKGTNV